MRQEVLWELERQANRVFNYLQEDINLAPERISALFTDHIVRLGLTEARTVDQLRPSRSQEPDFEAEFKIWACLVQLPLKLRAEVFACWCRQWLCVGDE